MSEEWTGSVTSIEMALLDRPVWKLFSVKDRVWNNLNIGWHNCKYDVQAYVSGSKSWSISTVHFLYGDTIICKITT